MDQGDVATGGKTVRDQDAWLCFADESGQMLRPPRARTWSRRGHTPCVRVRAAGSGRISLAGLVCRKAGQRTRLIFRMLVHARSVGVRIEPPLGNGIFRFGLAEVGFEHRMHPPHGISTSCSGREDDGGARLFLSWVHGKSVPDLRQFRLAPLRVSLVADAVIPQQKMVGIWRPAFCRISLKSGHGAPMQAVDRSRRS